MSTKLLSQPKHLDAIDINTRTLSYAPKGSIKQEQRIKHGLCFKCGSNAYLLSYYSISLPQTHI